MTMTLLNAFQVRWPARTLGTIQHRMHQCFHKTLPFRRRGQRISPVMGCDAVRGEEEHHSAVPRPAGSCASVGQGEQGKEEREKEREREREREGEGEREREREGGRGRVVRHLLEAFLVLLVHRLQTVVGTQCSIARHLHMLTVRAVFPRHASIQVVADMPGNLPLNCTSPNGTPVPMLVTALHA